MLIASCQKKEIKTTLIKGQTHYIKGLFGDDSEELWGLIKGLNKGDLKKIGVTRYKAYIQRKGLRQFQQELKNLYQYIIIDKSPRHYFDAQMINKFNNLHNIFVAIYSYYLDQLHYTKLTMLDRYICEILKNNPRYIGFSLEGNFDSLSRTIRKRIKELTQLPIIVGGSLTPFIDLKKMDEVFVKECFDYLVVGPGERALPSLIERLESKEEPMGIPNVFYKKNGKVRGNDLKVIYDLDSLPFPDFSQFDLHLYLSPKIILPLQTSRGCSWGKCAFCSHHNIYLGKYITFGIKRVIETIKHLQTTYNCIHFTFHDEEVPPARAKMISDGILDNNLKVSIYTYARLTNGYNNNKLLGHMRKAGFSTIAWGMESGCQRVLDLMDKGAKVLVMSQILKKSSKNKVANLCFIMFGFPGETKEEAQETIEFLKRHADCIEDIMCQNFILEPCSPIEKNPEKWGINIKRDGSYSAVIGMNNKEVEAFCSKFNVRVRTNSIKVTSSARLKYFFYGHNRRMLHFLSSSYKLLSNEKTLKYIKIIKLNLIFPIIFGKIDKGYGRTIFYPINTKDTCFFNQYLPEKGRFLDNMQEKIFILSDGRLSLKHIISTIYKDFYGKHRKTFVQQKCTEFLQYIFSNNFGVGFAKSWK